MKSDNLGALIERARASRSHLDFGKLLSAIERAGIRALDEGALLEPQSFSPRIGITGPPGAGKSTLMSALVKTWLQQKKRVGVIAVDPSSPHSQGAILGDRIRYGEWITDENVFVRSIGTRGSLGGLSSSVFLMLRAFDLLEFDIVLIETVGVGQTEVEIMHAADYVALVLVPESGDSIQAMKSGLLEIADLVIVNKSDRPGAEAIRHEIESELMAREGQKDGAIKKIEVFSTVATENKGVEPLAEVLLAQAKNIDLSQRQSVPRLLAEARALLRQHVELLVAKQLEHISSPKEMRQALTRAQSQIEK